LLSPACKASNPWLALVAFMALVAWAIILIYLNSQFIEQSRYYHGQTKYLTNALCFTLVQFNFLTHQK
jgi:hypothetical protein